jgi:type I restriction enzyme, S subunit
VAKGFTAFREGDVLFAKITPCMENGKVAIATGLTNGLGRGSTEFFVIRTNGEVLSEYVFHFLRRDDFRQEAKRNFTGTAGQQRVPRAFMENARIPLPPLEEQRRIVDILNRAASIRRLRDQANATLRALIPALFIKMFGDPGENPMGWEVRPLGDLIVRGPQNGLYRPKSDYGSGTRILRIDGFYDGSVTDPASWQRVRLPETEVRRYALEANDIVINRVNSLPYLGKSALIPELDEPAVFESNMMKLAVNEDQILPQVLIAMLQLQSVRQMLRARAKEAINQASINQTDVSELQIILPPQGRQMAFIDAIDRASAVSALSTQAERIADAAQASLMHSLLGERI